MKEPAAVAHGTLLMEWTTRVEARGTLPMGNLATLSARRLFLHMTQQGRGLCVYVENLGDDCCG